MYLNSFALDAGPLDLTVTKEFGRLLESARELHGEGSLTLNDRAAAQVRRLVELRNTLESRFELVDAMSIQYLDGSEVDYEQGLMGSRFIVNNPNAATTCGCGSSFSV